MSDYGLFLLPLFGFFAIGALGAWWQARNPEREMAARQKLLKRDRDLPRWRQMPKWSAYRARHDDPVRFARSARRRANILTMAAVTAGIALVVFGR